MATQVILGANIKKTSDRIDPSGNIINPKTKQVIQPNAPAYVPTPEEIARTVTQQTVTVVPGAPQGPIVQANTSSGGLSILDQIREAKANLKALEELKKLKIKEKKAELELLEQ